VYDFPNFPKLPLQQVNALADTQYKEVASYVPPSNVVQNANPNVYNPKSNPSLGNQTYGLASNYTTWTEDQNREHLEIHITVDQPLIYRGSGATRRQDTPATRILAKSVTSSNAQFLNRGIGDVYGN
jgi:hypothetical protein